MNFLNLTSLFNRRPAVARFVASTSTVVDTCNPVVDARFVCTETTITDNCK